MQIGRGARVAYMAAEMLDSTVSCSRRRGCWCLLSRSVYRPFFIFTSLYLASVSLSSRFDLAVLFRV